MPKPSESAHRTVKSPTRRVGDFTVTAYALLVVTALAACGVTSPPSPTVPDPGRTRPAASASPASPRPVASQTIPRETALKTLASLTVAPARSMSTYDRDRFPHWTEHSGGCSTRDLVLKRDGRQVKSTSDCKITSGSWYSVYENRTFDSPRDIDIDHVVPLANAWRSGADTWSDARRSEFANDLVRPQLLAVSSTTNRTKGDKDPSQWQPPNHGCWCSYAQHWVVVKSHWRLTITAAEKSTLSTMLKSCH